MLDLMRRKKRLKMVLWVVIFALSLGMLLFFVPGQNLGVSGLESTAATVAGEEIPMKEFSEAYRRLLDNYSRGGKNQIDAELAKTLGLNRQTLDGLIQARVIEYAAQQLGLSVSPQEIREAVESNPNMQDRGTFIGVERYRALLAANNLTVTQFENSIRQSLLIRKVHRIVSDSLDVTERQFRDEFTRTSQETQVSFAIVKKEDFKKKVAPTEAELRAFFDANKDRYKTPEERRAQYLLLSSAALAATLPVTAGELQDEWAKQSKEEQVDSSHILIAVKDPSKDAEARAKALDMLKRARAGEDFTELAKKYSDDPGSKAQGGNLGPFSRGAMVKEYEDAAFRLKPGEISDLVKSSYGYHIIKVLKHITPTLESQRASMEQTIRERKAAEIMKQKAQDADRLVETQKDLNALAKALNVPAEVRETGFMARTADPINNGISAAMLDEIFKLKEVNAVGKSAEHPLGYAIPKLMEVHLPPEFAQARPSVEKDYIEKKAGELARAEAERLSDEASKAGDLEATAKKLGLTAKTTSPFKRDASADPDVAGASQFSSVAFEKAVGQVSGPIPFEDGKGFVLLQVKSRTPFDEAAFNKQKPELREQILLNTRDIYFEEYIRQMTETLKNAGKIRINQNALDQVIQFRF
jgi:peptidyl-prolyl cis-trans isomerase D